MQNIRIKTEFIALGQFLKLADCISTGGQAKSFLEETKITVNGEIENRRGKKLYHDYIIDVEGVGSFKVVCS
ncbi:MAG: S4 domain-containing protein YaaA [Paenibacillaceae bacterium]